MSEKTLGVLGGMGPMATAYFMKIIIDMTDAEADQEHIPMLVYNHTTIPDRTEYILDNSKQNPVPILQSDAKKLQSAGVDVIAMPCNTAHFFFEEIQKSVDIPVLHIVKETVEYIAKRDETCKKIGILATKGTLKSGVFEDFCKQYNLEAVLPTKAVSDMLMDIIYNKIKKGKKVSVAEFLGIIDDMRENGCDAVILGCTELSVIKSDLHLNRYDIIDSLEVLSRRSIELCGKKVKESYFND